MLSLDLLKFNMQLYAMPDPNALKSFKRFRITFTWIKSRPMSAHAHSHDDWLKWLLWNFSWVSDNWRKLNIEFLPAGLTPGIWFKLKHKMSLKQTSVSDDLKYIGFFFPEISILLVLSLFVMSILSCALKFWKFQMSYSHLYSNHVVT